MKKLILLLALIVLACVGYYAFSEFNRGLDGPGKADHSMACADLFSAFEDDEKAANTKYLDKVIEVKGKVQEVSKNKEGKITIALDGGMLFGVTCEMFESEKIDQAKFKKGQQITLKGVCTGYLSDVVLVRCVEVI